MALPGRRLAEKRMPACTRCRQAALPEECLSPLRTRIRAIYFPSSYSSVLLSRSSGSLGKSIFWPLNDRIPLPFWGSLSPAVDTYLYYGTGESASRKVAQIRAVMAQTFALKSAKYANKVVRMPFNGLAFVNLDWRAASKKNILSANDFSIALICLPSVAYFMESYKFLIFCSVLDDEMLRPLRWNS